MFGTFPRGVPTPPHARGARQKRHHHAPTVKPVAQLEVVERKILAALSRGPMSLTEIKFQVFAGHLKADLRDEAIAELLKSGRARLVTLPHPTANCQPIRGLALPKGV